MPFGAGSSVLGEQVLVQERQLDRVGDLLDLVVEAADVVVGDVGHLFEHQLLDLGPGQLLEQQAGARVEEHRVAGAELGRRRSASASSTDPLLVGPADDERPTPSSRISLSVTTSPWPSGARARMTLKLSLSTTSAPWRERFDVVDQSGCTATRILRPLASTSTVPSSFLPRNVP